jgi:copper chaperone CopZ
MKTLVKIILIAVLAFVFTSNNSAFAVNPKIATLKVSGNCDMCKARIEKASKIDGVIKAEWNKKDKTLTASFDADKTSIDAIGKKIAEAGHDNDKAKATDKAYDKLPGCCQYR